MSLIEPQTTNDTEILVYPDNGEITIGTKRNRMLHMASGKFCAFIDDDDLVSDTYMKDILNVIKSYDDLECIGFWGEVWFNGVFGGKMVHSIMCDNWTEDGTYYYRPPNHLNPVRTSIARKFKFRDIRTSEDHFWSTDMNKSKVLKKEVFLGHKPTYIYKCRENKKGL